MIHSRTVGIAAGAVIEVFDEIGISPGRHGVTVQILGGPGPVQLVEDGAGANPGPRINGTYQFYTNKDPVYLKNFSVDQTNVGLALTEMP